MILPIESKCFIVTDRLTPKEHETRGDLQSRIDEVMVRLKQQLAPHVDQSFRAEILVRCGHDAISNDWLITAQLFHYPIE